MRTRVKKLGKQMQAAPDNSPSTFKRSVTEGTTQKEETLRVLSLQGVVFSK